VLDAAFQAASPNVRKTIYCFKQTYRALSAIACGQVLSKDSKVLVIVLLL